MYPRAVAQEARPAVSIWIVKMARYELVIYFYKLCKGLPKDVKYSLAEEIKTTLNKILELIIRANSTKDREALLREAVLNVDIAIVKIRLLNDLGSIKLSSYKFMAMNLLEVKKQLNKWKLWTEKGKGQSC